MICCVRFVGSSTLAASWQFVASDCRPVTKLSKQWSVVLYCTNRSTGFAHLKKITIVKCALFIATPNGEQGDECKDIWHVQTEDKNGGESSGPVARTMNCFTV